jgi:hypothetical protein
MALEKTEEVFMSEKINDSNPAAPTYGTFTKAYPTYGDVSGLLCGEDSQLIQESSEAAISRKENTNE